MVSLGFLLLFTAYGGLQSLQVCAQSTCPLGLRGPCSHRPEESGFSTGQLSPNPAERRWSGHSVPQDRPLAQPGGFAKRGRVSDLWTRRAGLPSGLAETFPSPASGLEARVPGVAVLPLPQAAAVWVSSLSENQTCRNPRQVGKETHGRPWEPHSPTVVPCGLGAAL